MEKVLLRNAKMFYPTRVRDVIDIRLDSPSALRIRTQDGKMYLYDDFDQTLRVLPQDSSNMTEMEFRTEFASRLKRIMLIKGMSQNELAAKSGVSRNMINRYVTGRSEPGLYSVDKIARALECSIEEFRYTY